MVFVFKCKVLGYVNKKCSVLYGMDFRRSFDGKILPYGLHREWYRVDVFDGSFVLIKRRRCRFKYGF